jgi:hypothetical protein
MQAPKNPNIIAPPLNPLGAQTCDPSKLSFFSKIANLLKAFYARLMERINTPPSTPLTPSDVLQRRFFILSAGFSLLSFVLLAISVVLATWYMVNYSIHTLKSLADDGDASKPTLPYFKDIEYQGVISTSSMMSEYPVLWIVISS